MPISGPGREANAEAVSYEAIRAAWQRLRMPYAPGASESVSVEPPSCAGKTPGSSASTEHAPLRDVLWGWPSPTPCREKRSSAQGRVCSFPSWPEAPTGWAPCPCVRTTVLETGPVWATTLVKTRDDRDSPKGRTLYWYARPSNASGETVCVEGGSRHESTRPSGRSLRTNRRDGCIERCVSASTSWTGACEGPGSERAGPRLVVTYRLSWVQWSRGCRTLTSSRLEGPALSSPSPAGPRFLHARQEHLCSTQRWTERPWTWEDAGRIESRSRVWWFSEPSETAWGALARPPETVQAGPGEPQTKWSTGTRLGRQRVPKWGLSARCDTYLAPWLGRGRGRRHRVLGPDPAAHWRKKRGTEVSRLCPVHCRPRPLGNRRHRKLLWKFGYHWPESQWRNNPKREKRIFYPALHRGKERTHHLLKSRTQCLGFARPRNAACPGTSRAWQVQRRAAPRHFPAASSTLQPEWRLLLGSHWSKGGGSRRAPSAMSGRRGCNRRRGDDSSGLPGQNATASVRFCATENCWAKLSNALPERPAWEIGESRKRDSLISARSSHRWRSWTTRVDIVWPRDRAMTFVARRARSVAVRSSCIKPGSELPSYSCFNAMAW